MNLGLLETSFLTLSVVLGHNLLELSMLICISIGLCKHSHISFSLEPIASDKVSVFMTSLMMLKLGARPARSSHSPKRFFVSLQIRVTCAPLYMYELF